MNGYIKLHRKITDWEWYQDANTFRVFIHLLIECNHEDKKWRGETIKRGECFISIRRIAEALNLSVKQVRVALEHLQMTQEVAIERASERARLFHSLGSFVTIENYENYQMHDESLEIRLAKAMAQRTAQETAHQGHNEGTSRAHTQEL